MINVKTILEALSNEGFDNRVKYHLTLGQLICELVKYSHLDTNKLVGFHSYRGYYSDLAFEQQDCLINCRELASHISNNVLGKTFQGYKGGDFIMGENTPLWISQYGTCSNKAVIAVKTDDQRLTLVSKQLEL